MVKVGRIDYTVHNICITCNIKYPKSINRCTECSQLLRTKRHNYHHNRNHN